MGGEAAAASLEDVPVRGGDAVPAGGGQAVVMSGYPFDETVDRLKAGIAAADLWLIAEIDPQMLLRRGGFAIPATRQLLYFHPRYMARLLAADAAAIVEAPLRFVIMASSGGGVVVRYPEPETAFGRYEATAGLGRELGGIARAIAAGIAPPGEPPSC